MNENIFTRDLRKSFEHHYGSDIWIRKMAGGPYMVPGIPDLLACVNGRFVAIECKQIRQQPKNNMIRVGGLFTQNQINSLNDISKAGGWACGIVHLQFLRSPQAILLAPGHIPHCEIILPTVKYFNDLYRVLYRVDGHWNVDTLSL